jgi:hypothetical protein
MNESVSVKAIAGRVVTRWLAIVFLICAAYLFWAWLRWDQWAIAHDTSWPHGLPYPDQGLMALEHYYDQEHPAPRGSIKLTGEFSRVQMTTGLSAMLFGTAGAICGLPTALDFIRRPSASRRGFPSS